MLALAGALLLMQPAAATEPAASADALIARLARPAPATVAFAEVRFSPLLREPVRVAGELSYEGPEKLERRVSTPYREHTQIHGESVRIEREGAAPRTFALARSPELRGLLHSFAALLAGDAMALRRYFDIAVSEQDAAWRMTLTPRDARSRRRVREIIATGVDDLLNCVTLHNVDGGASLMLLGESAEAPIPNEASLEILQRRCTQRPSAERAP